MSSTSGCWRGCETTTIRQRFRGWFTFVNLTEHIVQAFRPDNGLSRAGRVRRGMRRRPRIRGRAPSGQDDQRLDEPGTLRLLDDGKDWHGEEEQRRIERRAH